MIKYKSLINVIKTHSNNESRGITFIESDKKEYFISYKQLYANALNVLYNLQQKGIKQGEELVFQIEDNEKFTYVYWACILGGIIPVPVSVGNNDEHKAKVFKIWETLKQPNLIISQSLREKFIKFVEKNNIKDLFQRVTQKTIFLEEIEEKKGLGTIFEVEPTDIAFIQFSSGSTGNPKGVVLTHENLIYNIYAILKGWGTTSDDSSLSWMPLTHDLGMIAFHLTAITIGINQYLMPTSLFIRRPTLWLKKANEHRATQIFSPNFGYKHFLKCFKPDIAKDWNLSHIRSIVNGAEPISSKLCNQFLDEMSKYNLKRSAMLTVYGLAEASVGVTIPSIEDEFVTLNLDREYLGIGQCVREVDLNSEKCVSFVEVGFPIDDCYVRICDENDQVLKDNQVGYIQISGKNVTKGYYNNLEATEKVMTKDGWLNTGDLGFFRNGNLVITGRAKDIIFVNGQNYYPHDIERIVEEIEGVELGTIAVCGVRNKYLQSEDIITFIIFKKSLENFVELALNIKKCVNEKIGLDINEVIPIKKMPKTTSGKVQRYLLGEQYLQGKFSDVIKELKVLMKNELENKEVYIPATQIEIDLLKICEEVLKGKNISLNENFFDIGVNSILLTQITDRIEEKYPGKVTVPDFFTYPTISKLANFIEKGDQTNPQDYAFNRDKETDEDVAIIGISVKLPMADDIEIFCENIKNGKDCVREFPESRRKQTDLYLKYMGRAKNDIKYLESAYLDEVDQFDYKFFKITPKEASLMDPVQRLFLETAYTAIEDSGYGGSKLASSNTGVYLGFISDEDGCRYKQMISDVESFSMMQIAMAGNLASITSSRISYLLDLTGPSMLVDTACSSSLVAVHLACQALKNGECDQAIAGGVRLSLLPLDGQLKIGMESSDGKARTFDNSSDGTGMGEGAVALLLKPLRKAIKDRDNIYAVIKGSAVNQDGSSIGITAPNSAAQANVLIKAWNEADIKPETITYIEAHGTGTKLGDPVEIEGIKKAFGNFTDKKQFCAISSVKTNIGHLYGAAGIAGLVKAVLSLKNEQLFPNIHFDKPNHNIDFIDSPVYINDRLIKWEENGVPRRCGISAFGFCGTNCHVVLEEYVGKLTSDEYISEVANKRLQVLTLSAMSKEALGELIKKYKRFMDQKINVNLTDICFNANTGRGHYNCRLAIIINDKEELKQKLNCINFRKLDDNENKAFVGEFKVVMHQKEVIDDGIITEFEKREITEKANVLLKEFIKKGCEDRKLLEEICLLYIKGANVEWDQLYIDQKPVKISLPTYPFERTSCWINIPETVFDSHLYHTMGWKLDSLQDNSSTVAPGNVLILKDQLDKRNVEIIQKLRERGANLIEVQLGTEFKKIDENNFTICPCQADYEMLLEEMKDKALSQIIHLLTLTEHKEFQDVTELEGSQKKGIDNLYYLIKAIAKYKTNNEMNLVLVSKYVHEVTGQEEKIYPENAPIFGLAKVVEREFPQIYFKCIDIDYVTATTEIITEITTATGLKTSLVAYRNGNRYVQELKSVVPSNDTLQQLDIKDHGVYIITGGVGGIGLEIAKYLAGKNKVNLALMNRSKLPEREAWNEILENQKDPKICSKIEGIQQIEYLGAHVDYFSVDITTYEKVNEIIEELRKKYGRINGVINSAGILGYNFLSEIKEPEEIRKVMIPKVQGTWILDKVTEQDDLDFFILFSSILSITGAAGQAGYTAANAYMDSFAEYRNKRGKKTLTINWVAWKEVGMAADGGFDSDTVFKVLTKEQAIQSFEEILNSNQDRVIIGKLNYESNRIHLLERYHFKLANEIQNQIKKYSEQSNKKVQKNTSMATKDILLTGKHENKDYTQIEKRIGQICCDILGYSEISIYDNFFDLGADSIQLTQIHTMLEKEFERKLIMTDLFSYPSVAKLAEFIGKDQEEKQKSTLIGDIQEQTSDDDIAIIGISLKMPLANDQNEFWNNLINGRDCITDFPESRRKDIDSYMRFCNNIDNSKIRYYQGGFLDEIDKFDYKFFRLTPKEASLMDPNQRLLLQTVWGAIEDAGYAISNLAGSKTGIYIGFANHPRYTYGNMVYDVDSSSNSISIIGNLPAVLSGRISYLLDLKGPSMLIDTACSSSITSVHLACKGIKNGDCELAIAGGVKINLMPFDKNDEKIGIESSNYRTRAFDNSSDGTGVGEGVGAILLKPLKKALKDGDHIYAVIKGSAVGQDGASVGLTAPNALSQSEVICEAWKDAGIDPETISYIETHGTGTILGDPIEIDGLCKAFGEYTNKKQFCAIGALKSNIGHLYEASGIAGLIKTILALKHEQLPPNIHFNQPNSKIEFEDSPVYVNNRLTNWTTNGSPRRCGISAFGLSGTNCHIVLQEAPEIEVSQNAEDILNIFTFSAKNSVVLQEIVNKYKEFMKEDKDLELNNICYSANTGREHYEHRLAFIVKDIKEFRCKLELIDGNFKELKDKGIYYDTVIIKAERKELSIVANEKINEFNQLHGNDKEILEIICELYIKGADIDWSSLYINESVHRVSLPTYQFERSRCWVQIPENLQENQLDYVSVAKDITEEIKKYVDSDIENTDCLEEGVEVVKEFGCVLLIKYFQEMGVFEKANESYTFEDLKTTLGIIENYSRLYEAIIDILREGGYVQLEGEKITVTQKVENEGTIRILYNLKEEKEKLINQFSDKKAYFNLLEICLLNYKDILLGNVLATSVIFPNYSMKLVENIYKGNRLTDYFNELVAKYLKSYLSTILDKVDQQSNKLKILEIGAGTGGTSTRVLERINVYGKDIEYYYTDISRGFIDYGKKTYGPQYPFVNFKVLDIQKDINAQGFEYADFDFILATNVIHATTNIKDTINQIQKLLKKNGLLILNEITHVQSFSTLTFGLLEGWWLYNDEEVRMKYSPLLNCSKWKEVLKENGFMNVATIEPSGANNQKVSQSLIIGQNISSYKDEDNRQVTIPKQFAAKNDSKVILKGRENNKYTEIEEKIALIYKEILGYNEINIYDNFYELGGDSILAIKIVNEINMLFDESVNIAEMLNHATIAELAVCIEQKTDLNENSTTVIKKIEEQNYYPLSAAQRRMFVLNQINGDSIGYNLPLVVLFNGELGLQKFEEVFKTVVNRHESLRTSFTVVDGEPMQKIHDNSDFITLSYLEVDEEQVNQIIKEFIQPFSLGQLPLFRAGLIKIAENNHIFIFDVHHIVFDGWSVIILLQEIISLMNGESLAELEIQYKDFAAWQNELFESEEMIKQEKTIGLASLNQNGSLDNPVLDIPTDFTRPSLKNFDGDLVLIDTDEELAGKLTTVALETGTTLHMVMLAAYNILLSKYSGQEDIVVGSPILGRNNAALKDVIGMFINMLSLRNYPKSDITFNDFLLDVKEKSLKAYENQDYQFDSLVGKLNIKRNLARNPLFDYVFAVQGFDLQSWQGKDLNFSLYDYEYKISRFDMFLSVLEGDGHLRISVEYSTSLFKRSTIEEMAKDYIEILNQLVENRDIKLGDISIKHSFVEASSNILLDDDDEFDF